MIVIFLASLPTTKIAKAENSLLHKEQIELFHKQKKQQKYVCRVEEQMRKHRFHKEVKYQLRYILAELELKIGRTVRVNSDYRTHRHNRKLKNSVPNSSHCTGHALDISVLDNEDRYMIIKELLNLGVNRIGIGKGFLHLDIDKTKPENKIWVY